MQSSSIALQPLMSDSKSDIDQPDIDQEAALLEKYIDTYILQSQFPPEQRRNWKRLLKSVLLAASAMWGVPWREAAYNAGTIFPSGMARYILSNLFSAGIVITVGCDGVWVMSKMNDRYLSDATPLEQKLTQGRESKISTLLLTLMALTSCIPPVYSAIKYNSSSKDNFLSIFTLIGSFPYNYYGYASVFDTAKLQIQKRCANAEKMNLLTARDKLIGLLQGALKKREPIPSDITSTTELIEHLASLESIPSERSMSCLARGVKFGFQAVPATVLPTAYSAMFVYLSKEFFNVELGLHDDFAYPLAIFIQVPAFVVSMLSTFQLFGILFDSTHACMADNNIADQQSNNYLDFARLLTFIISLNAPTAGGYITYTTLSEEGVNEQLTVLTTISVSLTLTIFSNYTFYHLLNNFSAWIAQRNESQNGPVHQSSRLRQLIETLSKTKLEYFEPIKQKFDNVQAGESKEKNQRVQIESLEIESEQLDAKQSINSLPVNSSQTPRPSSNPSGFYSPNNPTSNSSRGLRLGLSPLRTGNETPRSTSNRRCVIL